MLTTMLMLMFAVQGPSITVNEPPTDAEIMRALPRVARAMPFVLEEFRDEITIVKNQTRKPKVVGPLRVYPILGPAALATDTWECSVYYTETIKVIGLETSKKRVAVVYIDTEMLAFWK